MKTKVIELWKNDCEDCEAAKTIVGELEDEGFVFEKHNIEDQIGQRLWDESRGSCIYRQSADKRRINKISERR